MKIQFSKYQGTGNDFVIIDAIHQDLGEFGDKQMIARICDRKFGVGADGLILLKLSSDHDFTMQYFNADGSESTMCGNGGRCIVHFAKSIGLIKDETRFMAIDGVHQALINDQEIQLEMQDVLDVSLNDDYYVLNTGSPHYVEFVEELQILDVFKEGRTIRNSGEFSDEGINVNFAEDSQGQLFVRTYERGVEDETLSCGTGVTAAALAYSIHQDLEGSQVIPLETLGGSLKIKFERVDQKTFKNIWLCGPAEEVFKGTLVV